MALNGKLSPAGDGLVEVVARRPVVSFWNNKRLSTVTRALS